MKTKRNVIIMWMIFFTLFGGLRWRVGGDWDQYYEHFLRSDWSNIFSYDRYGDGRETLEPGFVFVNALFKTLFGEFYFYNLFLVCFIQITFYKFSYHFSPRRPLLMYTFLMIMSSYYFPVRAAFAISIGYWCYHAIREQNLKKYLIIVFCAIFIHYQCIILLPIYWFGLKKLNFFVLSFIYLSFAVLGMAFQKYFSLLTIIVGGELGEKAAMYTEVETEGFTGASHMGWILNYCFLCIYVYLRKIRNLKKDYWYNCLINTSVVYNAVYMIFAEGMGDLARMASCFFPAQAILFISSINYFIDSRKRILRQSAVAFFIVYYIYKLTSVGSGYYFKDTCIPYKTIFDYSVLR